MAQAGLDYTIEIPDQPCWSQKNSFSQRGKEARNQRPVVILLGWGGCKDKNLAKYSAIYHKRKTMIGASAQCGRGRVNMMTDGIFYLQSI